MANFPRGVWIRKCISCKLITIIITERGGVCCSRNLNNLTACLRIYSKNIFVLWHLSISTLKSSLKRIELWGIIIFYTFCITSALLLCCMNTYNIDRWRIIQKYNSYSNYYMECICRQIILKVGPLLKVFRYSNACSNV